MAATARVKKGAAVPAARTRTKKAGTASRAPAQSDAKPRAQLAAELALINRIQQAMAAKLGFQAIVDLVGDTLREMFDSDDLSLRWWDPDADTVVQIYCVEHGKHLPKGPPVKVRATNKPLTRLLYEGMVAGYTGTNERATYTCIGDTVNLASRLEAHTKIAGRAILIDSATHADVGGIDADPLGAVEIRGKSQPVDVFAVAAPEQQD